MTLDSEHLDAEVGALSDKELEEYALDVTTHICKCKMCRNILRVIHRKGAGALGHLVAADLVEPDLAEATLSHAAGCVLARAELRTRETAELEKGLEKGD
jgi:hypothetical protein